MKVALLVFTLLTASLLLASCTTDGQGYDPRKPKTTVTIERIERGEASPESLDAIRRAVGEMDEARTK